MNIDTHAKFTLQRDFSRFAILLAMTLGLGGCQKGPSGRSKPKIEKALTRFEPMLAALAKVRDAFPPPTSLRPRSCADVQGRPFRVSWNKLVMLTGGERRLRDKTGDPMDFNDYRVRRLFRPIKKLDTGMIGSVEDAFRVFNRAAVIQVGRVAALTKPLAGHTRFNPGSITGWVVVFDKTGKVQCSRPARATNTAKLLYYKGRNFKKNNENKMAVLVNDLARNLAKALKDAVKR